MNPDLRAFFWVNDLAGHYPILDWIMKRAANDYLIPVTMALFFVGLWISRGKAEHRERRQRTILISMVGAAFATAIVKISNEFFFRPRPFIGHEVNMLFYEPIDSSFPSNAAAVVFAVAFGMWLGHRKAGYILGFLALLMGFSRVYVGIHYPLDIVGGFACGAAGSTLAWLLFKGFAKLESIVPARGNDPLMTILYNILRPVATIIGMLRALHLA